MQSHEAMEIILRQMDFWYQTCLGSDLLEMEQAELDRCLIRYGGRHLLQIGGPSEVFLFEKSPIAHRVRLTPEYHSVFRGPTIQANLDHLPLLTESIDLILMPHILEYYGQPQELLRQLYPTLIPGGHLIIFGFNPYSLWGLKRCLNFGFRHTLPWHGKFRTARKVKNWLEKAGFTMEEERCLFFRPPFNSLTGLKKTLIFEAFGPLLWSNLGGIYLMVAKKNLFKPLVMPKKLIAQTCPSP